MKPADIDPSLRAAEPLLESLEDGFSPPQRTDECPVREEPSRDPQQPALGAKSPF